MDSLSPLDHLTPPSKGWNCRNSGPGLSKSWGSGGGRGRAVIPSTVETNVPGSQTQVDQMKGSATALLGLCIDDLSPPQRKSANEKSIAPWRIQKSATMHMLENPPKAHSVFGKTSRTNSAIFVEGAKCNQLHPGAAWGTLERSQAEISMARIRLWEISGKMTKIDFLKLRSPFQGTLPATGGGGWKWRWGDLV